MRTWSPFIAALLLTWHAVAKAQQANRRHDVIQGRVTSDSGRAVPDANVVGAQRSDSAAISRRESSNFVTVVTDTAGRFTLDFPNGDGAYVVIVTKAGFQRLTLPATRSGGDSVIVVSAHLTRIGAPQGLPRVVSTAKQPKPDRNTSNLADVGAAESNTVPQNAARRLPPDLAGDLAAIAAMTPGVMPTPGGISVLGLGPGQNSITLNGVAFAATDIPRDAATRVRVTTSSYDPSIGWFSGARTQVDLIPGDLFTTRSTHWTLDAPQAQYTDPISAKLGQQFTNFNGSMGGDGQLVDDKWAYNFGLQGGRKSSDWATLVSADPGLLQHAGVSSDSVRRLTQILSGAQVPLSVAAAPLSRVDDNVSFIGRIDHLPYDWGTLTPARTTWGITGYGKWARTQGQGLSPTGTPAHAGTSSQTISMVQGEWSTYFGKDYLADVRSGLTMTRNASAPYLRLPDGRVLVASTFPDGSGGVSNLSFGGNAAMQATTRAWTWESIADLQLYPPGFAAHKVRFTADARLDGTTQDIASNSLGTFSYNSLADLAANRPASFTRVLKSPVRAAQALNAFAALGDLWHVNSDLYLKYGLRLEGDAFEKVPEANPAVASTFGVATDHAPDGVSLSPRFGFVWSVPGAAGRPVGSLSGGVGQFRNLIDPSLLAAASVATGLPNGSAQLTCFGDATPAPAWNTFTSDPTTIPAVCANGAPPSFVDAAPVVRVFAPDFTAQRSWRGNLAWTATALRMPYGIDLTYSSNLNQRGTRELNFTGAPRFTTPDEGRPVFVNPSSIAPSTGVVSPVDARLSQAFGRVTEGVTDLRSTSAQMTLRLRPYVPPSLSRYAGDFIVAYTLSGVRNEQRGFDGVTFGDPATRAWARSDLDARHQFVAQAVVRPHTGWNLFLYGHLQSGLPYTPMIRGDVNGDGLPNDVAYIVDPAAATDPAVGSAMRSLLTQASPGARGCLLRQLGRSARRNSCEGPWSASLNASLAINGQQVLHQNRLNITINFANPLGGLDQLWHGSNRLHGWGTQPVPDPILFDVRRFDPNTQRYAYGVNPRFGATDPTSSTVRAPFRVTLDVNVDIAPPQAMQQLDRWLKPGRKGRPGAKVTAADLVRRYQRTVPDPYIEVLQQSDSLLLTAPQAAQVQAADQRYRMRIDSIWTSVAQYLSALPDNFDAGEAFRRTDGATDDAWEITRLAVQRDYKEILTPNQLLLLPLFSRQLYNARDPVHFRFFPRGGN
jgi:hypothetical protein